MALQLVSRLVSGRVPVIVLPDLPWVGHRNQLWPCIRLSLAMGSIQWLEPIIMDNVVLIAMVDGWPSIRIDTLRHLGAKARPSIAGARAALLRMASASSKGKGKGHGEVWTPLDEEYGELDSIVDEEGCVDSVDDRLASAMAWCRSEVELALVLRTLASWQSDDGTHLDITIVDCISESAFGIRFPLPAGVVPVDVI